MACIMDDTGDTCSYGKSSLERDLSELRFMCFDETDAQLSLMNNLPPFGELAATDSCLGGGTFNSSLGDQGIVASAAATQDLEDNVFGAFDSCPSFGALSEFPKPMDSGMVNLQSLVPIQVTGNQLGPSTTAPLPILRPNFPISSFAHYNGALPFQGWSVQGESGLEPDTEMVQGLSAFHTSGSRTSETDNFGTSSTAAQWEFPGLINDDERMQQAAGLAAGTVLEACKLPTKGFAEQDAPATPRERRLTTRQEATERRKRLLLDPMVLDSMEEDTKRGVRSGSGASGGTDTTTHRLPSDSVLHSCKKVGRPIEYKGDIDAPSLTEGERRRLKRRKANRESAARVRVKRQDQVGKLESQIVVMKEQNKRLVRAAAAVSNEQAGLDEQLEALQRAHSAIVVENSALCDALLELHNQVQAHQASKTPSEILSTGASPFQGDLWGTKLYPISSTGIDGPWGLPEGFIIT